MRRLYRTSREGSLTDVQSLEHITWERIAQIPAPGMQFPIQLRFSPDNTLLTYLYSPSRSAQLSLWALDLASQEPRQLAGETPLESRTLEEELRRERQRIPWEGITTYQFAHQAADYVLIPHSSSLEVLNVKTMERDVIEPLQGVDDPYLTPKAQSIVYVRERSLWVFDLKTRQERSLMLSEDPKTHYGIAEYVAQEEFDRAHGFFVSPEETWIAFEAVNTASIPEYTILHMADDPVFLEQHAYPFVGQANAVTRLGVMPLVGGEVQWITWEEFGECYLIDVHWHTEQEMIVQILTRDQKSLIVLGYNPVEQSRSVLWTETAPDWINITHDLIVLHSGDILTTSENNPDGFRHLVIRSRDSQVRWITQGPWMVTEIVGVSPDEHSVIIQATKESPLERHIYQVDLLSGEMTRLSEEPGIHKAVVSSDFRWMIDQVSSLSMSTKTVLKRLGDSNSTKPVLIGHAPVEANTLHVKPPELVAIDLEDGTTLYGAVYRPDHIEPHTKAPVIVSVYGGPHAQLVTNTWALTVDLQAQYFAQQGYFVIKVDNRGSANRGKAFEQALFHRFGTIELDDQIAALNWIHQHYPTDPTRVGIYGWSYGGYMTLTALMKAPDVFKVGVAGAPVTDFRLYDTAYTERYMGTDETNHAGYEQASVLNFVPELEGKLLVIHGMIDENVHFRHTALLIDALVANHKDFSLLALPKTRHMPRGFDVLYTIARKRSEFFETYL
ncbi:dipeptidyl-peptidase-4 [Sulfobacillus thermosulfidooxidans DSM 9293]|uniref:Dipeptidyl-peptidase-4 n=1 Tax=Sulfobacillus thermosulfidooxidans (strain DSM 9293 / VKM B-1269 / AT-1) TaxID=929705 RepID=A0A1W1W767_SULTA|nr:dipeptidyl-peptidase-4 [Sulfobacillus thermosulfidooxidans DSM 9293]